MNSLNNISFSEVKNDFTNTIINQKPEKTSIPNSENNHSKRHRTEEKTGKSTELTHKLISLSLGSRVKRSTERVSPSALREADSSERNREEILDAHDDLINLGQAAAIFPTCTNGVEGHPNPPIPSGYGSWEAFLASDGMNSEIKNPRQELVAVLQSKMTNFVFNESRLIIIQYNNFKDLLNNLSTPRAAKRAFEKYQTDIERETRRIAREVQVVSEAIIKKMTDEIQSIKHNTPNRWLQGHCWSSTTNTAQWTQNWQSRYLPKALQAIANIPQSAKVGRISIQQVQQIWLQKARESLREHFRRQGWVPTTGISVEEP